MGQNLREIDGNVTPKMKKIEHDGPLTVHGNVEQGSFIIATGDITIDGEVRSSKVKSIKGSIVVRKGIKGSDSLIYAGGGSIQTISVYNATLKAETDVFIKDIAIDAHIVAKKSIFIIDGRGHIDGGESEAGVDIIANVVGDAYGTVTIVRISDFKQRELFARLSRFDSDSKAITRQMENLEKFIEVIRLLGGKVVELPLAKKQDLALKVKKYNQLKSQLEQIENEKRNIMIENQKSDELERTIIVKQNLFSGVEVYIDNAKLPIQHTYHNVILYKRGIIIVGDYDKYMYRKKYAY